MVVELLAGKEGGSSTDLQAQGYLPGQPRGMEPLVKLLDDGSPASNPGIKSAGKQQQQQLSVDRQLLHLLGKINLSGQPDWHTQVPAVSTTTADV